MREMKQTATFAASLPVIALIAACWGSVFVFLAPPGHYTAELCGLRMARYAMPFTRGWDLGKCSKLIRGAFLCNCHPPFVPH